MTAGDIDQGSGVGTWWTVTVTAAGAEPLAEVDERLVDLVEALEEHSVRRERVHHALAVRPSRL